MAKKELILAIDIGADSIKMAEFSYPPSGGIILEKFAFTEFGGDLKDEELFASLEEALRNTLLENNFEASKVYLSISGESAFIRVVKLPPIGNEEEKVRQIVEYEAKQNVPFPIDEVVWDSQLISGNGEESEIEVMFAVIKDSVIEQLTDMIENLGKEVVIVDVAPAACYNAARANGVGEKEEECIMILNIGSRCSSLVFIDSGRFFVRTIAIAGYTITQQISKEFGIPFADAEELKRRHGFVALGGAYEEPDSEVAATISKIIRNVMTRLHGELNRSINVYRSQQKGHKPSKLLLAGGSSVMAFTPRFFSEKLKIPVEYFNPFQVVSLSKQIEREALAEIAHMFSEVIGLGLRHATVCPIEISLVPEKLRKLHEIRQKIPYFYSSAASLVICLALILWAVWRQEEINREKVNVAVKVVESTSRLRIDVKNAEKQKIKVQTKYKDAKEILAARPNWVNVLNVLQQQLPDNMWLVSIAPAKAPSDTGAGTPEPEPKKPMFFGLISKKNLFGTSTPATTETSSIVEWLEIKGHYLSLDEHSLVDLFKENLKKSQFFSDNLEELKSQKFTSAAERGNNNIASFEMMVKLKNPFSK